MGYGSLVRLALILSLAIAGCAAEQQAPVVVVGAVAPESAPPALIEERASSDAGIAPPPPAPPSTASYTSPAPMPPRLHDVALRNAVRQIELCDACSGMCNEACEALHVLEQGAARLCARHDADCDEATSLFREARAHYGTRCASRP